jgi:cytochrome c oxidase subunit 3
MTDVSLYEAIPADVPASRPARPRLLLIGTALASASVIMLMAGLLGIYIKTRADVIATGETWLPSGVTIPLTQPNMMAVTMVFSAVVMFWALSSLSRDDRANTYIALGLVLVMGFAFLSQTAYLLTIMDLGAADSFKAPLLYAVIGTHMAIVIAAMGYVAIMGLRTLGGEYNSRDREGLYGAAMFWYVSVVLYMAVWYAIYITK